MNLTELNNGRDVIFNNDGDERFMSTITTTSNQKNNYKKNVSTIDLGECEYKLKGKYNISLNDSLYILKIEAYLNDMKIPKIEYEVYYPLNNNFTKLDLSLCKDININISIPVDIPINELDKYNASSGLYNDLCYTLSENGTDKTLKDRQNDFVNNNMMICEENCEFIYYDNELKKASCSCSVKEEISLLTDIKINSKVFLSNFMNTNNFANFKLIKCIHLLFNLNNLLKNSANYLILIILIISIITIFIFALCDYLHIKNTINEISEAKKNGKKNRVSKYINKTRKKTVIISNDINGNIDSNKRIMNRILTNNKNTKKRKSKAKKSFIEINNKGSKKQKSVINNRTKKSKQSISVLNKNNTPDKKKDKEDEIISLKDYEMNSLQYKEAIKIDKRTYLQYYLSLLRTKHLIIFTFFNNNDYNSKIIKIYIFALNIAATYTINAMFYSETIMHRIYMESGKFNFIQQLPEMIYSSLITALINTLIKSFGLCQNNILKIKQCNKESLEDKKEKETKNIKYKIILFFIITYILLFFFWIFLGCFCSVYKNTQIHLLKEVLSSFAISNITPFFIQIFPVIVRIPALRIKSNCLYKFSKILQIF